MFLRSAFASLGLLAALSSTSSAAVITQQPLGSINFQVGIEDGFSQQGTGDLESIGDGLFGGAGVINGELWTFNYDVTIDPDPFISGVFSIQNNTAVTQTFIIAVSIPIVPQGPLTVMGGSIGVTLTDSNFNGVASVTDAGDGVYFGQIDGGDQLELFADPFSLSVAFAGDTVTTNDDAGLPGVTIPGPAANATIGIVHRFKLTPGDSASFTSFYVVEAAVPEVGSSVLMAVAGVALAGVRLVRRRKLSA